MTVIPVWDNDAQTVIRFVYYGMWTWDDVDTALDAAHNMAYQPTHIIIDLRESCTVPPVPLTKRSKELDSDAATLLVMVGEAYVTRPFFDTASRIYRVLHDREDVLFVDDVADARRKIEAMHQPRFI